VCPTEPPFGAGLQHVAKQWQLDPIVTFASSTRTELASPVMGFST
jgi:hypothetical protein